MTSLSCLHATKYTQLNPESSEEQSVGLLKSPDSEQGASVVVPACKAALLDAVANTQNFSLHKQTVCELGLSVGITSC